MLRRLLWLLAGVMMSWSPGLAQVELPSDFQRRLEMAHIDFFEPLEGAYKAIRVVSNEWLTCDFAMRSRRERMEIHYRIEPARESDPLVDAPHVRVARLLNHLASNDEESVVTVLSVRDTDLREQFQADWGKIFFFTPKPGFSRYRECRLVALYREGAGMALIFYFFDEPSPALDYRLYALQFQPAPDN